MKRIRIGTRESELALWQANKVREELEALHYECDIVPIKSTGDIVLDKPLYELGITGIFTKNLDIAMLNGDIDIAVHSMKDVPTLLPKGIIQAAVLKRANHHDILVLKENEAFLEQPNGLIATGSLRRKAMWLNRYPTHKVVDLRGNVNTRLEKLEKNNWNAAVFAAAGLERIGKRPTKTINLTWMTPAPAQGAIMITALDKNEFIKEACKQLNDYKTQICTDIEREFLSLLEGGCTAPIGALASVNKHTKEINFEGVLLSRDGIKKISITKQAKIDHHKFLAKECADYIINKGGKQIMLDDLDAENITNFSIYSTKKLTEIQRSLLPTSVNVDSSDFIKTQYNTIPFEVLNNKIDHVIITSKNGVKAILNSASSGQFNFKKVYCVGRRTKDLIEKHIGTVTHSASNAKELAAYLSSELKGKEVTYFCSDLRLDTLPKILSENGIMVNEIEAYKTIYHPEKVKDDVNGILFYSPSTVESYIQQNKANKIAFCIGESTAKEAEKHFKNVQIANLPTVESVIEMVNLHFVKK